MSTRISSGPVDGDDDSHRSQTDLSGVSGSSYPCVDPEPYFKEDEPFQHTKITHNPTDWGLSAILDLGVITNVGTSTSCSLRLASYVALRKQIPCSLLCESANASNSLPLARTGSGTSYPGAIADDDAIVVGVMVKGVTDGTSETINVILEDTGVLGAPLPQAFTIGSALVPVSRPASGVRVRAGRSAKAGRP